MKARDNAAEKSRIQSIKWNPTKSPKIEVPSSILDNLRENLITGVSTLLVEKIMGQGFKYLDQTAQGKLLAAMNTDGSIREMVSQILDFDLIGN